MTAFFTSSKWIIYITPLLFIAFFGFLTQYFKYKEEEKYSTITKALATSVALLFCFNGAFSANFIPFWLVFAGLCFYLLGDLIIIKSFVLGTAVFAASHIFLIISFYKMAKPVLGVLIVFALIFIIIFLTFIKKLKILKEKKLMIPFLICIAITSFLPALTFGLPSSSGGKAFLIGAICLTISDVILVHLKLKENISSFLDSLSLSFYCLSIYFLALGLWL